MKKTKCFACRDDSDFVQGPFTSFTMLEWYKAGYFRSSHSHQL